jgi:ATP-dependent Lon protease
MNTLKKTVSINHIKRLQYFFKNRLYIQNKFNCERIFLYNIIEEVSSQLLHFYSQNIVSVEYYKKYMIRITNITNILKDIPYNISWVLCNNKYIFSMQFKLIISRLYIINVILKIGCISIKNCIRLLLNIDIKDLPELYRSKLLLYNSIFHPKSIDIFKSNHPENITFTSSSKNTVKNITLISSQLHTLSFINMKHTNSKLLLKLYGCGLYIPYKDTLLVVNGICIKDNFNLYKEHPIIKNKIKNVLHSINNIDIPKAFSKNYIQMISLKDILVFSNKNIIKHILEAYLFLNTIKKKNISGLVKQFLISDIFKQYEYIKYLTLDKSDDNSNYIAYLLYDLIKSNNSVAYDKSKADTIFDCLDWTVQKSIKNSDKTINKITNKLENFNETNIPYEKRIVLMKVSKNVKSKAFNKLKELKNGKNGESNSKAQQYVDGLLKIPFGSYKEPSIIKNKKDSIFKIINHKRTILEHLIDLEETHKLNDYSLTIISNIRSILEKIKKNLHINTLKIIYTDFKTLLDTLDKTKKNIDNYKKILKDKKYTLQNIKQTKVNVLKKICKILHVSNKGKKIVLIENISSCLHITHTTNLVYITHINLFTTIKQNIKHIIDSIDEYHKYQANYLSNVTKLLNQNIYGLEEPKRQIKRIIAQWISGKNKGHILGLEGPPGTGKTTLAKYGIGNCIQDSDNTTRPFVFLPLGGSCNGSTLEGHNYTYVGSNWGKIVDSLMTTKCMNPIIYIDELDKVSKTEHGKEIIGILTHLTDSTQNEAFNDKYFSGIPIDLSKCLIIFSYNNAELVDKILLDRIHTIKIDPISLKDKIHITKLHLLPEIYSTVGIYTKDIVLTDNIIEYIIVTYTYEAGARKLKEKLYQIIREINLLILSNSVILPMTITKEFIDNIFKNNLKVVIKKINKKPRVGIVNGLYATSLGIGGITIIQIKKIYSKNILDLLLTGNQGDIMKESMKVSKTVSLNYISQYFKKINIAKQEYGIHIHCPNGGTPKDGPSAGSGITLAIISFITKKKIRHNFAITGEIDLDGNVIQIGGLHSKLNGAKSAGVNTVLCPKMNETDYENIITKDPTLIDDTFNVIFIETIKDVVSLMLLP